MRRLRQRLAVAAGVVGMLVIISTGFYFTADRPHGPTANAGTDANGPGNGDCTTVDGCDDGADPADSPSPSPSALVPPSGGFRHPGVLVSAAQLDFVKAKLATGAQPWRTAYDRMRASSYASLSWKPKPRATVECGGNSVPDHGCSDERDDALAAYTDALIWYLSRDTRYAAKAIQILNAWPPVLREHTNSNAPLQAGWTGADFARAAELIRYSAAGWAAGDIAKFAEMLRKVYLPLVAGGRAGANGNWELIMMDAATGIAVFLGDRATFNRAVAIWRGRVPAYIYLTSDGPTPKSPPGAGKSGSSLVSYWQGQSRFVDGLSQETCRDFGHTGWGLDAAAHVASTAWVQGIDLYAEMRARLTAALEFHAQYDLGTSAPSWLCGGVLKTGLGPVLELAYNHYHRLGATLPKTGQLLAKSRPAGASYFIAWETLTHADNPMG